MPDNPTLLPALPPPSTCPHVGERAHQLIPIRQAFRRLAISNATGYRLIKSGKLGPIKKIGRRSFITASDLELFIASL